MVIPEGAVFILGAGASAAYGFPTGTELLQQSSQLLTGRPIRGGLLEAAGCTEISAAEVGRRLLESGAASIDEFVRDDPSTSMLAKCAIANLLFINEYNARVLPGSPKFPADKDWAGYLIRNLLSDGLDRAPQVSFVTFNFERSFEKRLVTTSASRFQLAPQDACRALTTKFRIVHVSGSLGDAEWDPDGRVGSAPWGGDGSSEGLRAAAGRLFFVHEERARDPLATAQRLIRESPVTCFLGFGFHPSNVDAILPKTGGVPEVDRHRRIIASGLGLTKAEARRIEQVFSLGRGQLRLELSEGKDALSLLREHPNMHGNLRSAVDGLWE